MSLLFGWGISFAADTFERGFTFDHDGHGRLLAREPMDWTLTLSQLGLTS